MRSVFICTSIVIVVSSVFSQQPLVRYSETLKKAVPHHYDHDKENADGRLDKIARGHKIEPYQPPLRPHKEIPWLRWVHEGRWAAQANKNTELHKVRARLLEEKLKPNHFVFKPHINPQLKPRLKQKGNARTKREVGETEKVHKKIDIKANVRNKRDIMMPQLLPEMIMQPHLEAKIPQSSDQFKGRVKESDKREKRQIVYFINRPPQLFARSPRTTPNPFIRDTHIDEYDIIRPEVGEREGMIPTIESGRSDLGSYPLVSETSDLEYESDYTISMSDSEEWHNYPLTTPSGPNPGWRLSTLADIYQKQRRSQNQILTPERTRHKIKSILQIWRENRDQAQTRAKRSPKERKAKIGAYKAKIKQRRKVKDMKKKRRIIRNSKEDKAVKEDFKDEKAIERLLERPRLFPRQTAYQVEEASREILWSNGTHNIVEDKGASVKWINETHYIIYKDKDNSTEEWYNQHHVLCYNEEWENKTSEEKRNSTIGAEDEDEESDDKSVETVAKKKPEKGVVKKKKGRKKSKKVDEKKKRVKTKKKIQKVKNIDVEPKDPRERKTVKMEKISGEETEGDTKKDKKVKLDNDEDSSEARKEKRKKDKKSKTRDDKDEQKSSRKKKTAKKDKKSETREKQDQMSKENSSSKKHKTEKEKKKDSEKRKKSVKSNKSSEGDGKKKKKKAKDESGKKDKEKTRKKRSIYHSDESKSIEVRWEKVEKSDYDGWTVFGDKEDKSEVYDASYELIETRNITTKRH